MGLFSNIAGKFGFGGESRVQNSMAADRPNGSLTVDELVKLIGAGATSSAGVNVNEATAMRVSAVYACVALIAGAISTLPLPIYKRTKTGREAAPDHPYFWILNEQPEANISAAAFWEYLVSARLFYGDAFAEIVRPSWRSSVVTGLKAHHPLRVQPFYASGTSDLFYRVTPLTGPEYVVDPADMLHIPSLGFDGLTSPSPITYAARQAVGISIATADQAGRFFANGARPDFALQTDGNLSKEQVETLRDTWTENHGGSANSHRPAILTGGLKVQPLTLTAADSKILETASWNLEEICRVLGVPPFMVGSTEKTTSWGTGQENMGRGFVKYTLLRDLRKIEQEINRKFWPARETYFVEFDVSGLERGDLKSENESLRVALGRAGEPGWMSVNEVRHIKLLPPIDGGDEVFKGINQADPAAQPADQQAQQDQQAQATAARMARIEAKLDAPAPQPVFNIGAPVVNVAVPEQPAPVVNANINVPEQAAPVVQNTINVPEPVVNVEAVMPAQAAPVVQNTVNLPETVVHNTVAVPDKLEITAMPDRATTTEIVRDGMGNIIKSTQTEKDA